MLSSTSAPTQRRWCSGRTDERRASVFVLVPQPPHKESLQFLKQREKLLKLRRRINPANLVQSSDPIKSNQTQLGGGV